jgi:Ca2+-binding RTX toxin-like protein
MKLIEKLENRSMLSAGALTPTTSPTFNVTRRGTLILPLTDNADTINIRKDKNGIKIDQGSGAASITLSVPQAQSRLVKRIVVEAGAGDDNVSIDHTLGIPAVVNGGAGRDTLTARGGKTTLSGGAGDDTLVSEPTFVFQGSIGFSNALGFNQLIGGADDDILSSRSGGDLLFGGAGQDRAVAYGPGFTTVMPASEDIRFLRLPNSVFIDGIESAITEDDDFSNGEFSIVGNRTNFTIQRPDDVLIYDQNGGTVKFAVTDVDSKKRTSPRG